MVARAVYLAEARGWLNTPQMHQASLKGIGADCIGFIIGPAVACGITAAVAFSQDPEFKGYGRDPDPVLMEEGCDRYLERIPFSEARAGDILRMRFKDDPRHFALITNVDPMLIMHAYRMSGAGRVIEHGLGPVWRERVNRAYRWPGVD